MELLAWMAVPGFLIILAYVVTKMMSYEQRKEQIERDIDRHNYLSVFIDKLPDSGAQSWPEHFAELSEIRCRLKRRGIDV